MSELDPTEQLKSVASRVISDPDQLAAFLHIADAKKLGDANGEIDAEKVSGHVRTLFSVQQQPRRWGQVTGHPGGASPVETAREALRRRHRVGNDDTNQPAASDRIPRGRSARDELAKRYGKGQR